MDFSSSWKHCDATKQMQQHQDSRTYVNVAVALYPNQTADVTDANLKENTRHRMGTTRHFRLRARGFAKDRMKAGLSSDDPIDVDKILAGS